MGKIPKEGERPSVTLKNLTFTVEKVEERRVSKILIVKEMNQEEEAEKRGETVKPAEKVAEPQPVYKVRTTKNVSIKTVAKTASWRLESKEDVDKYLAALRENLLKEMDEDTIVNIEL